MQSSCSEKKKIKPLKITEHKRDQQVSVNQTEKHFFLQKHHPDHVLSRTFYFTRIYVLAELWIFFYFVWCSFAKKGLFPAKKEKVPHKKVNFENKSFRLNN